MMAFIQHLHLQYRLWIAELNADINVLRIFEDCLADLQAITGTIDATHQIDIYRKQFVESRKKMDELRHEMYINKMKLAAVAKTPDASTKNIEKEIRHEIIKKRYEAFRKIFDDFKKAFQLFYSDSAA